MRTHLPRPFPLLAASVLAAGGARAQETAPDPAARAAEEVEQRARIGGMMSAPELDACFGERGLRLRTAKATPGYTLVQPLTSRHVHLVDLDGAVVHTWDAGRAPGGWSTLLDDGTLLHAGRLEPSPLFRGGGIGGALRRLAPDGTVVWRMDFADGNRWQHHDVEPMPNGNVLVLAWERIPRDEALARGRDPSTVGAAGLWPDAVYEVRPTLPEGGEIVWQWRVWDHLVQHVDPAKPDHAKPGERAGRFDVNAASIPANRLSEEERKKLEERRRQMAALGYGGDEPPPEPRDGDGAGSRSGDGARSRDGEGAGTRDGGDAGARDGGGSARGSADGGRGPGDGRGGANRPRGKDWEIQGDWLHTNAIAYHAGLDLIALSSPELGEVFVIDHRLTTEEARGSTAGRFGKGGDVLWRWGNPAMHGAGRPADQKLFFQHDPHWIDGADGSLRLLVFNNGARRPGGDRSSVEELVLPFDRERGFAHEPGRPFGPAGPAWTYEARDAFYSSFVSGAARLASGNTLIASGAAGRIFEVTPAGEVVWDYANPHGGDVQPPEGAGRAPRLSVYRADRYPPDHPGVRAVLGARAEARPGGG